MGDVGNDVKLAAIEAANERCCCFNVLHDEADKEEVEEDDELIPLVVEQFRPPLLQSLALEEGEVVVEPVEYVGLTLCMMGFVSSSDVSSIAEAEPDDVLLAAEDMG